MNNVLESLFNTFKEDLQREGVRDSLLNLCKDVGMDLAQGKSIPNALTHQLVKKFGQTIANSINTENKDNIERDVRGECDYFSSRVGDVLSKQYTPNLTISDKMAFLTIVPDTHIQSQVKEDLCKSIAEFAIVSKNQQLLELATIQSDGLSIDAFDQLKDDITQQFDQEELNKIDLVIKMKENPTETMKNISDKARNPQLIVDYVKDVAVISQNLPENYKEANGVDIETGERELGGFEFVLKLDDNMQIVEIEDKEVEMQDIEQNKLSIKPEAAVDLINKLHIKGTPLLDQVCEANLPAEDPNRMSTLIGKFNIAISNQQATEVTKKNNVTIEKTSTELSGESLGRTSDEKEETHLEQETIRQHGDYNITDGHEDAMDDKHIEIESEVEPEVEEQNRYDEEEFDL